MATFGTFVDAATLKASELNSLLEVQTGTATLRQSAAVTMGSNSVLRYYQVNKVVFVYAYMSVSSTPSVIGTAGTVLLADMPVTAASNSMRVIGAGSFWDFSANDLYRLAVVQYSTTRFAFFTNDANSSTAYLGTTGGPNTAINGTDYVRFNAVYEAA